MAMQKEKTSVNKRLPAERAKDFREVSAGYDKKSALQEAKRCLMCPHKPCTAGCPVSIDIPSFIKAVLEDDIKLAFSVILNSNALP